MSNNKAFKVKNGLDLGEYSKAISDTAVDVFVYDTRKDSDGGAWRKRTQHTSWYNETLNTATRGSRKEFPAVAVIVADNSTNPRLITIYDGDDPDLPMWMVFKVINGNMLGEGDVQAVSALNGIISVACGGSGYDFYTANMVEDAGYQWFNASTTRFYSNVGNRNVSASATDVNASFITISNVGLVSRKCNDVAMTVLPNAPIDAATGLPVPTIAVATDGGTSIIRDDGTVDNHSDTKSNTAIEILGTNYAILRNATGVPLEIAPLNDAGAAIMNYRDDGVNLGIYYPQLMVGFDPTSTAKNAYGAGKGLNILDDDILSNSTIAQPLGKVAFITSDYNTGWQNGDIKLATLSDTDDTNVTGTNLVSNGTFDSNIDGWASNGAAVSWHSSGRLQLVSSGGNQPAYASITCEVGKRYYVELDFEGSWSFHVGTGASAANDVANIPHEGNTGVVTRGVFFTATQTTHYLVPYVIGAATAYVDNVSVTLAEDDRSVNGGRNGNGLQVFGTVTKSAVSSGADLVAYSGFSSSNYLEQPYNSDLDFGTGDFSFMVWLNTPDNSAAGTIIHRSSSTKAQGNFLSSGAIIQVEFNGTNLYGLVGTNGFSVNTGPDIPRANIPNNIWTHYALVRKGSTLSAYLNGKLFDTDTNTLTTTNTSATLFYGERPGSSRPFNGKMALTKWSATAPSPEQIAKIYEDEKFLFQDNAQATLYGSSDAVTALAYDDTTELLHVGTSAGRSVFQGLRRVDNTTTAVGAAISASNGLVADE